MNNSKQSGFSLVELSIVLVILGLLAGGVLSGQSLIRASELRSVATQYNTYVSATNSFRDKYFGIPGDLNNATSFWNTGTTANGNGDGSLGIADNTSDGTTAEMFAFWHQLSLAGLIEGGYDGNSNGTTEYNAGVGDNVPRGKLSSSGWTAYNANNVTLAGIFTTVTYGNAFAFGQNNGTGVTNSGVLLPEEAWNVDKKIDDGVATTGKVVGHFGVTTSATTCTLATTAAGGASTSYNLSITTKACPLYFVDLF